MTRSVPLIIRVMITANTRKRIQAISIEGSVAERYFAVTSEVPRKIVEASSSAFHPAAFFPIVSALAWGCTLIMTRMMSGTERAITVMTYSSIAGVCILSALVPFVWVTPTWHDIAFGILIGVASTAGQWIVVLAFRYADASVLAPFSYTQLLWVSVLGFFIFGEVPDVYTITGAAFIVASGLYTAHRERVRRSQLLAVAGESSPNA